jgi:hypothetical protein
MIPGEMALDEDLGKGKRDDPRLRPALSPSPALRQSRAQSQDERTIEIVTGACLWPTV